MKKILLAIACIALSAGMMAQDVDKATVEGQAAAAKNAAGDLKAIDTGEKNWKFDGVVGLNAAATGLINWAAGGNNNVNGVAYAKLHLLYHKNAIAWETNFDTDFGMTWIDQENDALQKSSDNIKLATKFGWEFKESWYLTALGSFQSQYAFGRAYTGDAGYDQVISKWLAPSYTDISIGIDWKKSVNGADFSIYLSPIAGRIATAWVSDAMNDKINAEAGAGDFRTDLQQRYGTYRYTKDAVTIDGVDYAAGDKIPRDFRAELGLSFKGSIAYKYENLTLGTTLGLFTPYQGKGFDITDPYFQYSNKNRQFGHFDVDWDVAISYQFLKVLNVTLNTNLKYYPGVLIADKNGVLK
ncbi:MAG: DUF3078 domain-containing protein, partial [Paludibacteraceae bacterium]|nr:DUF3078 domain-containing protein [Paludibacteraceae bacterium]